MSKSKRKAKASGNQELFDIDRAFEFVGKSLKDKFGLSPSEINLSTWLFDVTDQELVSMPDDIQGGNSILSPDEFLQLFEFPQLPPKARQIERKKTAENRFIAAYYRNRHIFVCQAKDVSMAKIGAKIYSDYYHTQPTSSDS